MWPLLISLAVIYLLYWIFSKPDKFPKGPPRLPFIGSIPFMDKNPLFHQALEATGKKWGCDKGIMGLYFGNTPAIAVWDPKLVREVLTREEFQGRPAGFSFKMRSFGKQLGVFFGDGPSWVEHRRFTLRQLRDLGLLGLQKIQHHVQNEITDLIYHIKSHPEGPVKGSWMLQGNGLFTMHVVNVLWAMMSGKHYSKDDAGLQRLFQVITRLFRDGQPSGGSLNAMPWLRFICPKYIGYTDAMETWTMLQDFVRETIDEHKIHFNENEINDFIDAYLLEMKSQSSDKDSFLCDEELIIICMDIFGAGSESVGNTLSFAVMYLGLYPQVQDHLWEEMKSQLGVGCNPCLEDRSKLPYLEAVLQEVMRINPIAPLAVPHRATQATTLAGYSVPKDAWLALSLWSTCSDPSLWKDPKEFKPERFINSNGQLIRDETSLVFSLGKRQCVGASFSRNCLFLFFGAIVANFEFKFVPGEPLPSEESLPGFTTSPRNFNIIATERK